MLSIRTLASTLGMLLIFLMLFIPTSYVSIKAPILGLLILFIAIDIVRNGASLSKQTVCLLSLYSLIGLLFSFYGQLNGNAGAFRVISTQVLWPLCYLFISTLSMQVNFFLYFMRTLMFALVCIVIYSFTYLGNDIGVVPDFLYFELDQGQSFGLYEGFIEYKLHTITSLIFLVPILFHMTWNDIAQKKFHLPKIALCLISLILVFLTGRKAFWLIILLLPILIFFSNMVLNSKQLPFNPIILFFKSPLLMFLLFFVVAMMIYVLFNKFGLNINTLFTEFVNGFDPEASAGANSNLRTVQFNSLMNGWYDSNLIFGSGNGGQVEVIRDPNMPWAYELTYIYMLFSTGLFGVLFYLSWFLLGVFRLRFAISNNAYLSLYIPPILTGVLSIAIVSATNPYFAKFDYLWVICLPHLLVDSARYVKRYYQ